MAKISKTRVDPLINAASNVTVGTVSPRITSGFDLHQTIDLGSHDKPSVSANYGQLINWLFGKGVQADSELLQILGSMGINMENMSGAQQADWNKQLLEQMLAQLSEEDARKYNQGVLADQRLYDSPTNQLARLMASGISRDKAIELLSGSGGSGGSVAQGAAAAQAAGIPASQSDLNDIQGKTAIAGAVFQGVGTLSSLLSLGFSAPAALAQTKLLQYQNVLTGKQVAAYTSAGKAFQILNAAGSAADSFGSVGSAAAALQGLADNGNQDAVKFISSGGLDALRENAPFASSTLGELYKSERGSSDYAKQFENYLRNNQLQQILTEKQTAKIGSEMALIGAQKNLTEQQVLESVNRVAVGEAQIRVLNAQGRWQEIRNELGKELTQLELDLGRSQEALNYDQGRLASQNADLAFQQFDYNEAGFPMLKQNRIDELTFQTEYWKTLKNNPAVLKTKQMQWLMDVDNAAAAAYAKQIYLNATGDFAEKYPALYMWSVGLNSSGVLDMVKTDAEAGVSAAGAVKLGTDIIKAMPK